MLYTLKLDVKFTQFFKIKKNQWLERNYCEAPISFIIKPEVSQES